MFATAERGRGPSLRRIVSGLVLLAFFVPAWWTAEAGGEGYEASGADHPDDSDMPALSGLPGPSPGLNPDSPAHEPSSAGAVRRLLRPPRG